jgi:hypothetical protein
MTVQSGLFEGGVAQPAAIAIHFCLLISSSVFQCFFRGASESCCAGVKSFTQGWLPWCSNLAGALPGLEAEDETSNGGGAVPAPRRTGESDHERKPLHLAVPTANGRVGDSSELCHVKIYWFSAEFNLRK